MTFREELEDLSRRLNLRVVYALTHPLEDWDGECGRIHLGMMARYLPENRVECEYFI